MAVEEQDDLVERVYIREAAETLNRRMATLRKWEQLNALPEHLRSHRGHRGWRYWTPDQIEGIRGWLRDTDRRPGKGLPHYNPTALQLDRAISAMRKPRTAKRGSTSSIVGDSVVSEAQKKLEAEAPKGLTAADKEGPRRKKPGPRLSKRPGT